MKYSEAPEAVKTQRSEYIKARWEQLADLQKMWIERIYRYLFLINAGGAVAILTFMGSRSEIAESWWARTMLLLFVLGLILVGVMQAYNLHFINWLFARWRTEVTDFYDDKLHWEVMTKDDFERAKEPLTVYILGYISFGCFIAATGIGALIFHHLVK